MTDETIEINCPECNAYTTGIDAMTTHIIDFHANYTPQEAIAYAQCWAATAHEEKEKADIAYSEQRKEEKGLEAWEAQKDENHVQ